MSAGLGTHLNFQIPFRDKKFEAFSFLPWASFSFEKGKAVARMGSLLTSTISGFFHSSDCDQQVKNERKKQMLNASFWFMGQK